MANLPRRTVHRLAPPGALRGLPNLDTAMLLLTLSLVLAHSGVDQRHTKGSLAVQPRQEVSYSQEEASGSCAYPLSTESLDTPDCGYRLGDVVSYLDHTEDSHTENLLENHERDFPGSLAAKCAKECTKVNDFATLARLVKDVPLGDDASKDWCTLHVRAGDVLECSEHSVAKMLANQTVAHQQCTSGEESNDFYDAQGNVRCMRKVCPSDGGSPGDLALCSEVYSRKFVRPWAYFDEQARAYLMPANCSELHIFAGSQFQLDPKGHYKKTRHYLQSLQNRFCNMGIASQLHLGGAADVDFATMSRSRVFIGTGGGFSQNLVKVRSELGLAIPDMPGRRKTNSDRLFAAP